MSIKLNEMITDLSVESFERIENLDVVSQRVCDLIKDAKKQFLINSTNHAELSLDDNTIQNIPLIHENFYELICSIVLNAFLKGRQLSSLYGISFREFESFSKDLNHLEAFKIDKTEFYKAFRVIKSKTLLIIFEDLSKDLVPKSERIGLVEFNVFIRNGLKMINLTPVSADFLEIHIKIGNEYVDFESLNEFLTSYYIKITGSENLKVVAV